METLFTCCTFFILILGFARVVLCSGGLLTTPHNGGGRQSSARPRPQLISHMTGHISKRECLIVNFSPANVNIRMFNVSRAAVGKFLKLNVMLNNVDK